jgi:TRAP-type uncharacterized transport system substrate-binding protein
MDPEGTFTAEVAKAYRDRLAHDGIELKLVPTAGAADSLARLRDLQSGISVAILPSGLTSEKESPDLVSLGTLFYQPLWLFYRGNLELTAKSLRGLRISTGPEGSGTRQLSLELLRRVGIIGQNSTLLALTPQESLEKLERGEIDGVVLLGAWESPMVQQMLRHPDLKLASIRRADAFVALYPYLNKLVLPAGVADMVENRPPADVPLLAPKASLIVRGDLHPAIQYLLLGAAAEVHSGPGVFRRAGQFPAPEAEDLPLSGYASQYYKTGSPFLQRHLPFWLAVLVQELLVLLIPALAVLYPSLKYWPALYGWIERRRVYKLYTELKLIESELDSASARERSADISQRLARLEDRVTHLPLPIAFSPLLYGLRRDIGLVRQRIQELSFEQPTARATSGN